MTLIVGCDRTVFTKKSMDTHVMDPLNFMAHLQLSACLAQKLQEELRAPCFINFAKC